MLQVFLFQVLLFDHLDGDLMFAVFLVHSLEDFSETALAEHSSINIILSSQVVDPCMHWHLGRLLRRLQLEMFLIVRAAN